MGRSVVISICLISSVGLLLSFQNCAPQKLLSQVNAFENIDLVDYSDMRLTNDQYNFFTDQTPTAVIAINASIEVKSDGTRKWGVWPKNSLGNVIIPVKFDPNISSTQASKFLNIAAAWATNPQTGFKTKLSFVQWNNQAKFLYVAYANCGTSATMGYTATQYQDSCRPGYANGHMNLPSDFFQRIANGSKWAVHAVRHELGHVIGFAHEHQRSDRNQYIKVILSNIPTAEQPGYAVNANYKPVNNAPYDYFSVMHYSGYYENDDCTPGLQRIAKANGDPLNNVCTTVSQGDYASMKYLYGL